MHRLSTFAGRQLSSLQRAFRGSYKGEDVPLWGTRTIDFPRPVLPTIHEQRQIRCFSKNEQRPDPFARRPTAKCDPYGQGGKPLPIWEANALLATLDPNWKMVEEASDENNDNGDTSSPSLPPQALVREFVHSDFIAGSKFVAKIAAVAQLNQHFPSIQLERQILSKQKAWQVVTRVRCHTLVLGGLSTHDFHLAMLIDVETERPEVNELILPQDKAP